MGRGRDVWFDFVEVHLHGRRIGVGQAAFSRFGGQSMWSANVREKLFVDKSNICRSWWGCRRRALISKNKVGASRLVIVRSGHITQKRFLIVCFRSTRRRSIARLDNTTGAGFRRPNLTAPILISSLALRQLHNLRAVTAHHSSQRRTDTLGRGFDGIGRQMGVAGRCLHLCVT